jgi:hypothetical protein
MLYTIYILIIFILGILNSIYIKYFSLFKNKNFIKNVLTTYKEIIIMFIKFYSL